MADWTLKPVSHKPKIAVERPRVNMLEDFSEVRGARGDTIGGTFEESYRLSLPGSETAWAFFNARLLHTTFTKLTYHPGDAGFDSDDVLDTSGPEETVRFAKEPTGRIVGTEEYRMTCTFKRLVNE